jgi:hypothetical protein
VAALACVDRCTEGGPSSGRRGRRVAFAAAPAELEIREIWSVKISLGGGMGTRRKMPSAVVKARCCSLVARLRNVSCAAGMGRDSESEIRSRTVPSIAEVSRACWRGMRWGGAVVRDCWTFGAIGDGDCVCARARTSGTAAIATRNTARKHVASNALRRARKRRSVMCYLRDWARAAGWF